MCMACEQDGLYYRWQLLEQVARGELPDGMTEADLRALELPVPGEVTIVELADGTREIRPVSVVRPADPTPRFTCDAPAAE